MIDTSLGDTVVVMGAGPIGNMHVQMAKLRGADKVIQTEIIAERLEMARPFGADLCIDSSQEDAHERILAETNGRGADIVISASPSTAAAAEAVTYARRAGKVVWFGGLPSTEPTVHVNGNLVHYQDIVIYGSIGFTPRHYRQSLELLTSRRIDPDLYITDTLPLDQIERGMEIMKAGKAIKLAIHPNE
jgi:L-iditol 2-dehydrogenase